MSEEIVAPPPVPEIRHAQGTVYRITASDGKFYIGSTMRSLHLRLIEHLFSTKPGKKRTAAAEHFHSLGRDNVKIEEIVVHHNVTMDELRELEDAAIRPHLGTELCLNALGARMDWVKRREMWNRGSHARYDRNREQILEQQKQKRSTLTDQEKLAIRERKIRYHNEHKEEIQAHKQQQYIEKREEILKRMAAPYTCPLCGSTFRNGEKSRHEKTLKHQAYMPIEITE